MEATARDLYSGPLENPEFLEATRNLGDRPSIQSRAKWAVGAALAAGSLFFGIPEAAGSTPEPLPFVEAEGTYAVPGIAEWKSWLENLGDRDLHPEVLRSLRSSFREVIEPTGLVPGGMATPEGAFLLTWDFDEHHLELELFADHWEWFYKNRLTGRLAGEEDLVGVDFDRFRAQLAKYAS